MARVAYNKIILFCLIPLQTILPMLDSGMKESLNEVVHKSLNKLSKHPLPLEEDIDDTVLK